MDNAPLAPVVGAVRLGVVQPALGAVGAQASDSDADDVRGAVLQAVGPLALAEPPQREVERQRREQRVVLDLGAVGQRDGLGVLVKVDDGLLVPLQ